MKRSLISAGLALTALIGTMAWTITPASATLYTDWTSVSAGTLHTCGIRAGKLYCWGADDDGQVGNGAAGSPSTPQQITTATDWKSVSAGGNHTCAVRTNGKLYCWGSDDKGQLGNGAATGDRTVPVQVTTVTDWLSVSADRAATCAIRGSGKLYCWGVKAGTDRDDDPTVIINYPAPVTSATDWKSVSVADYRNCAIRGSGKLYCWGYGPLGNGTGINDVSPYPVPITTATDWRVVSADLQGSCAIRAGKLYCWGASPSQLTAATDWITVDLGGHSEDIESGCAVRGKLYCWGDLTGTTAPTQVTAATDWSKAATGGSHACGIRAGGKLYCWGFNNEGQVGDGTHTNRPNPGQV